MRVLVKYFFWLLSLFFLTIYYLLGTKLGHVNVGGFVEDYYSQEMGNKVEVLSLNIESYPFIIAEVKINDKTELSLKGNSDSENMDISYHLRGESFTWSDHDIDHPIDLKGSMTGKFSELLVKGEGELFYGKTKFSFIRQENRFEALEVALTDTSSKHLLKFLKYKLEIEGDVDIFMNFDYFSAFRKKGLAKISMKQASIPKISEEVMFTLDGEIEYKDLLRKFFVDVGSDIGKLHIANGFYNKAAELMKAQYGVHINELSYLEKLLGHQYQGELITAGNVKYEMGKLSLLGDSTSYGGLLEYDYQNDYLDLKFNGVSLEKVLRQLSFPALLSSKIYGTASYDIEDDIILVNTKLKETRFRRTKMTDTIYDLTDIDILKDVYDDSMFTAGYQNSVLTSLLKIDNGVSHFYLKNTRMNSKTNKITADFEVVLDGQEFVGDVYGTLEDPKVNLDMSRLIRYHINKKIDSFFGAGNPFN